MSIIPKKLIKTGIFITSAAVFLGQGFFCASAAEEVSIFEPAEEVSIFEPAGELQSESFAAYLSEPESDTVSPNVEYHSIAEIRAFAEQHPVRYLTPSFTETPSVTAPYSLGKVNSDVLQDGLNALNQVRYIAGLPYDVTLSDEYNNLAQAASLVNAANGSLSHSPSQPAGMDDSLYELGKKGAGSSNLAAGYSGLANGLLNGYLSDGDSSNISRVGHRRWMLNPTMKQTGLGIVAGGKNYGTYSAMYAFDRNGTSTATVSMWPAFNTPLEYFGSSFPWSYSTGTSEDMSSLHVTLTNSRTGTQYHFSSSSSDGYFNVDNGGYALRGCIIFRPSGISYVAGDQYHVKIEGLSDGTTVEYDVNFFQLSGTDTAETVHPLRISLDYSNVSVYGGETKQLSVTYYPSYTTDREVLWTSSNGNVAAVDSNGKVYGISDGTAVITATSAYGNHTASCTVKVTTSPTDQEFVTQNMMFRLYNPYSGEHFYTASLQERNTLYSVGWDYEGSAWIAVGMSNTPIYRLFNPYAGEHHYTGSVEERENLVSVGWKYEGIAWYSDDQLGLPIYRLYNPFAWTGTHHYTASEKERNNLMTLGWKYEGIAWHGVN